MEPNRQDWGDWLEGYLFDRRITTIRGPLDELLATRVATELMTLDATGDEPVTLQLDSAGGSLSAAFTMIDVIDALGVPVNVLCLGRVEGSAVAVAAAGSHRLALPNAQFRFGDPEIAFEARASEAVGMAEAHLDLVRRYHQHLSQTTGRSLDQIAEWCSARRHMTAAEALDAGVIDEISKSRAAPLRRIR